MSEGGVVFTILFHPGYYLAVTLYDLKVQSKEEAQHKEKILKHGICIGVIQVMKELIVKAVYEE